jgi:hypothetical protein
MSSDKETKNIRASIILEIIGMPPEYLLETLEDIIKILIAKKGFLLKAKK